jgi:hypothetical protein
MKKLGILVAVFALSAIGAASASAHAEFTASATGSLAGSAVEPNVFTTSGGTVTCNNAATSGTIAETAATAQHVTVKYSSCTAFGFVNTHISDATYLFTAATGTNVHVQNQIKITPTTFGFSACTVTVNPQTVGTVDYANSGANNVRVTPTVTGIAYTSTGGICGPSGNNGTYSGASEISRVGGGTLRYDHS